MSAAASGHQINYKVVPPTPKDLGALLPGVRSYQKFREGTSNTIPHGGPGNTGIIYGSNTNLGTRWWIETTDYRGRLVTFPLNNRDHLGRRAMPQFKVDSLFSRDANQP
jgi:hypothetical protein